VSVLSPAKLGRIEPKGGTRASYEKRPSAGSKSAPCCPECGVVFDLEELSMVEQMDAIDGALFCKDCRISA
jgi:hypothetical protein